MFDIKNSEKLENEFEKQLSSIINKLILNNFSENDELIFIDILKTFLKYTDISDFVTHIISNKISEVALYWRRADDCLYEDFRKILGIIIKLDNEKLYNTIATFFAKDRNITNFFLLLEETVKHKRSTLPCEKLFFSLLEIHNYDRSVINRFLEIINQKKGFIITSLAKIESFNALYKYVVEISKYDSVSLKDIIPTLILEFDSKPAYIGNYLNCISAIITENNDFTKDLLYGYSKPQSIHFLVVKNCFEKFIVNTSRLRSNMDLLINYSNYIYKFESNYEDFEKLLIDNADADVLYMYSIRNSFCNHRKFLKRLVEIKNEYYLVAFIKHFPEYKSLLSML